MAARKDISMKSSDHPELVPAPNQLAQGDTSKAGDLKWRITACLTTRIPDLKGIHITVVGNTAVLRGNVRTLQEKWLCLKCCRHVPGVMRIVDDLIAAEQALIYFDPEEGQS
jgi:osmotically-inducible protein OsmY